MTAFSCRILFSFHLLWIVYTECGYYDQIPTDVCGFKSVEYISGVSSVYLCEYNVMNDSWSIMQNIFNNAECTGEIINKRKYICSDDKCHCTETSSGYDCMEYAVVRTQDFDYTEKQCDPTSYTESIIAVNQQIKNGGMYQCKDSKLIFKPQNPISIQRPSLLPPSTDKGFDDCVSITCVNRELMVSDVEHSTCLPVNNCQNQYHKENGNSSWQYVCNQDKDKYKMYYSSHNCMFEEVDEIYPIALFKYQQDIVSCNQCDRFIKIKEYDVANNNIKCNEFESNGYNWNEFIFGIGCYSFWSNIGTKHSIQRSCTNSSYSVKKYATNNCTGEEYGEYTVNQGCDQVEVLMYNKTYSYQSFIEIESCGMHIQTDDSNQLNTIIISCIICLILYLFNY